jgi:hypothetical protein
VQVETAEQRIAADCRINSDTTGEANVPSDTSIQILREYGPRSLEQKRVSLDDVALDPNNVRFRHLGRIVNDVEAEQILWTDIDTKILYQEILVAGGLSEPIYIRRNGSKYLVKEGNRRVTCLRHAKREATAGNLHGFGAKDFATVPAYILDDEVTPEEEAILEARWHVMGAGKKQWPAFNQSAHIWAMHHRLGMPVAKIADVLGMSRPTVYKRLKAYEAMVKYQNQTQDDDLKKFSYFDEAYKSADVVKWLKDDDSHLEDLITWIHKDKFNRTGAKDMRELVKVLDDRPSREIFEKKDFNAAYAMFTKANPEVDSSTFRIVKEAIDALESIPRNEVQLVRSDRRRQEMLVELAEQANGVLSAAGVRKR